LLADVPGERIDSSFLSFQFGVIPCVNSGTA
jgi:hypothetical protein